MENTETQITAATKREIRTVEDTGPLANLFDTARFEHMGRIASMMAGASLIPEHLWKDKTGALPPDMIKANCFLIVNQSVRWGFDPFAVAPCTYVVGGKLGFEGKLVCAVINARAPIKSNLDFEFTGTKGKDDFTVRVFATLKSEDKPREIKLSVGDAKTTNQMWTKDPEQKLVYSGATKWARRHCPEIILGVLTDDDLERIQESSAIATMKPVFEKKPKTAALPEPPIESVQPTAEEQSPSTGSESGVLPPAIKENGAETIAPRESGSQGKQLTDADKLAAMISDAGLTFVDIKPHLPKGLAPRDAKGVEDLTDANALKIIESFDVVVDILNADKKTSAP